MTAWPPPRGRVAGDVSPAEAAFTAAAMLARLGRIDDQVAAARRAALDVSCSYRPAHKTTPDRGEEGPPVELQPASRFEWERIVRRLLIPGPTKLVGFVLAQYGDKQGEGIRPGTVRLSATCMMGGRTVERHIGSLRGWGLVERVAGGGGPGRSAAEYRLTIPVDLLDRLPMLRPDEVTPATWAAGVHPADPVDNHGTPATTVAGVTPTAGTELPPLVTELPPSGAELPPLDDITPANDPPVTCSDAAHQEPCFCTTQTPPPSRSLESQPHVPPVDAYAAAHALLATLPDLGANFMARVQAIDGMKNRVIAAAAIYQAENPTAIPREQTA